MSEIETILKNESGVKAYEGEHPPSVGLKAGAFADVGTIILTNRRLVYINKGGAARAATYALGGALAARAAEKKVSKAELDDVAKYPGSYSIPLQDITRVETARHFGSAYLRVDNQSSFLKPAHSFILGSGFSKNEDWVAAINSAIMSTHSPKPAMSPAQLNNPTPTYNPPPPQMNSENIRTQPMPVQTTSSPLIVCPSCGTLSNSNAKFCGTCSAPLLPPKTVEASNPKPKFCGNCGSPIGPAARFCESCGSKIA
jgi:hypothetical protein